MKRFVATAMATGLLLAGGASTAASVTAAPTNTLTISAQVPTKSVAQVQAQRKARNYLSIIPFSKKGLIAQLKYNGFSHKVSKRAVNSIRVSWKKQAKKKAKNYLRIMPFSRSGLIEQLRFDGFTAKQARYGVRAVGL